MLTYEFVKGEFEKKNYELISTEYVRSTTKMDCKCDKGHTIQMSYKQIKNDIKCKECKRLGKYKPVNPRKLTYEFVKGEFEKLGYTLLSTEYVRARDKLDYICDKGHVTQISYNKLKNGRRCNKCSKSYRMTFEELQDFYKTRGYEIISDESEYKSYLSILQFRCDNGHINDAKVKYIVKGRNCSICTGNKKLTIEFCKEEFAKEGLTLLEDEYVNAKTLMKFRCDKGHVRKLTWDYFKSGSRCIKCSGKEKLSYEFVKGEFAKIGYELLSKTFKNSHQKLKIKCDKGHETTITYTHFKSSKRRCSKCAQSNGEHAVSHILDENENVLEYDSEVSLKNQKNYRYDFYVTLNSGEKFLIEYDGRQHFAPIEFFGGEKSFKSAQKRDKKKTNYCRKHNIGLLRISYRHFKTIDNVIDKYIKEFEKDNTLIYFTDDDLYTYLTE